MAVVMPIAVGSQRSVRLASINDYALLLILDLILQDGHDFTRDGYVHADHSIPRLSRYQVLNPHSAVRSRQRNR